MKYAILPLSSILIFLGCTTPVRDAQGNCVPQPKISCPFKQKSQCEVVADGCKHCECVADSTNEAKPLTPRPGVEPTRTGGSRPVDPTDPNSPIQK